LNESKKEKAALVEILLKILILGIDSQSKYNNAKRMKC
jgi:hypothetical protein